MLGLASQVGAGSASAIQRICEHRRVTPNELVFTAVSYVLESANAEAAYNELQPNRCSGPE